MGRNKIGIFAPGQVGDIMTAMSVLKYRNDIWPNKDIVWFCDDNMSDALKFSPVSEIRPWTVGDAASNHPLPGAEGRQHRDRRDGDYLSLKCNSGVGDGLNRLDLKIACNLASVCDIEIGYFPLPWQLERVEQRTGICYPQISQRIFGVNLSLSWRPCLYFSEDEKRMVAEMMSSLPHRRTVMLENSPCAYSAWDDNTTRTVMSLCRKQWGGVNFLFASGGNRSGNDMGRFFDDAGCISGANLTARQVALANNHCDLFVGVAGALTFSTSCWGAKPVPKLIYTGCEQFGAHTIANGKIEVVTTEGHRHNKLSAENDFKNRLATLLARIP